MHKSGIAQEAIDLVIARRGRAHVYDRLEPRATALVVIDMQNTFMKEGAPAEVPVAREIVPNINRLAAGLRQVGGVVAWVQMTLTRGGPNDWNRFFDELNMPARAQRMLEGLTEGTDGWRLWSTLDVQESDLVVPKNRYSAFLPGSSDLPEILTSRGVDTVLITGTLTNVCCESSARDAMMRNFKTVMVSDANATLTEFEHQAALTSVYRAFGDVLSTDEVLAALGAAPGAARTAAE
ncbi:MAG TPA: isochorismatase family cysteine hydrolase [Alphaproteobacteria bacterium]